MDTRELVDYAASLDCIHCGLCLRTCPTYQLAGRESSSPRGRIHLMRAVAEGRLDPLAPAYGEELEFCLVCRHCESVCPAGVRFGEMMEHARSALASAAPRPWPERCARWIGFGKVLRSRRLLRLAFGSLRLLQRTGAVHLAAKLAGARGAALAAMPPVPPAAERALLPSSTPPRGERLGAVVVLEGCVMPELYGRVNRDTVAVLAAVGFECRTAPGHVCCGALHAHNGELEGARELARDTIARFEALGTDGSAGLPIAVNSAGCGAHMKAYGQLLADDAQWRERAQRFSARVRDLSELLAPHAQRLGLRLDPSALPEPVTYDDPCHLCHGQRIRKEPRVLLDAVQGLQRVELEGSESCCGSAGIYSLLRPADSQAIFKDKAAALERSGARVLVTANPGCQLQWESGLALAGSRARVMHLAEVIARALPDTQDAQRSASATSAAERPR
jgi:glycolate oxidase iron-sulfur subunit